MATTKPTAMPSASASPSGSVSALDGTMTATGLPESSTGCGGWKGRIRVADPRVSGEYHSSVCTQDRSAGYTDFWGVLTVWNEGGTWDGTFTGRIETSGDHWMDWVSAGSGAYDGLRLITRAVAGRDDSVWAVSNRIEPAPNAGPTATASLGPASTEVTGVRSCKRVLVRSIETPVGGVTQRRGEVDICTWTVTEPRLSGQALTMMSEDLQPDGTVEGWGTLSLRNGDAAPAWIGSYSLVGKLDGTTTVTTSLTGVAGYEGLLYRDVQVGNGDTWTVTGWVTPAE